MRKYCLVSLLVLGLLVLATPCLAGTCTKWERKIKTNHHKTFRLEKKIEKVNGRVAKVLGKIEKASSDKAKARLERKNQRLEKKITKFGDRVAALAVKLPELEESLLQCQSADPDATLVEQFAAKLALTGAGNGMPNGGHFNLNIIGVSKDKTAEMTGSQGHRIFVKLEGKAKIILEPGDDFQVTDANGTDGNGASLTLPKDVSTRYQVFVRALGKPGGQAGITSCYTDLDGVDYCLGAIVILERKNGRPAAINASKDLLNVVVCEEFDDLGNCLSLITIPLFGDETLGYFWDYDNQGLKLAQMRFYPLS